jgi:polyhydroxyalkanoate synthesis regulator phasin
MLLNSGLADTREGATTGAHLIEGLGALALGLGLRKAVKWKFGKEAVDAVSKSKSKGKMTEALALVKGETSTNFSRLSTEQAKTVISAGKYKTLGDLAKAMDSGELTGAQAKAVAQKLLGKSVGSIDDIAAAAKQASAAVNKGNLLPGQRAPLTAPNKGVKDYLTGFFGNKGEKVTQATHNKVAMPNITNLQVGRSLPVNKISSAIKEVAIKVKTGQMTKDEGLALIEGLKKAAKSGKPINTEQLTFQFGKSPQGKSILSKIGSGAMKFAVVPLVAGQIGKTIAGTAGDTVGGEKGERIGEITGGHFGFLAGNKVYNVMKNTISKKGWKWMLNRVISKGGPSLVARTIGKAGVGAITGATGIGAVLSAGWLAADAYAIYQILQEAEDAGEI